MPETNSDIWIIKHKTHPGGCKSELPYCGYDKYTLLQMIEKGYELFHNGNKVPNSEIKSLDKTPSARSGRKFTKNSQQER